VRRHSQACCLQRFPEGQYVVSWASQAWLGLVYLGEHECERQAALQQPVGTSKVLEGSGCRKDSSSSIVVSQLIKLWY
jgi:hypothetical protein